jgi:hypothetical protein
MSDSGIDAKEIVLTADAVEQLLTAAVRSQEGNAFFRGLVAGLGYPAWVMQGNWHFEASEVKIAPGQPSSSLDNGAPVIRQGGR